MKDSNLKPCPFCGSEAERNYEQSRISGRSNGVNRVYIQCMKCLIRTISYDWDDEKTAIKRWNTRT